MCKFCVFCGKLPEAKNKEHVIPQWLIKATGDPNRVASFQTYNPKGLKPRSFAFDQLTFPACKSCNESFSSIESQAQGIVSKLFEKDALTVQGFRHPAGLAGQSASRFMAWLDPARKEPVGYRA